MLGVECEWQEMTDSQVFAASYTVDLSGGHRVGWGARAAGVAESYAEEGVLCLSWVEATGHVYWPALRGGPVQVKHGVEM